MHNWGRQGATPAFFYMKKAIVLTYAPVNKEEAKLLRDTDIFKIACNNYCADLKPDIRLCTDNIVDRCLECDTCDVVSINYDFDKKRVHNGCWLPKRLTTLISCIDYLCLKGYNEILLVASNPEGTATFDLNNEGIKDFKGYVTLYKYSQEGNLDIPVKTIKEFTMLTDDEKILGVKENPAKKLMTKIIFTEACQYEVHTEGLDNKSIETGYVIGNILPMTEKERFLSGETEINYNGLIIRKITGNEPVIEEEKEPEVKPVVKKKPVAKKKVSKK